MKKILVFIAIGFLAACTKEATNNEKIITPLEKVAANYPTIVEGMEPETSSLSLELAGDRPDKWYRRKVQINDVGYDVRKTDSLVSPFMGEIAYTVVTRGRKGTSEKDAREGPENFKTKGTKCKATYAYQSSRWIRKSVVCLTYDNTWETPTEGSDYRAAKLLPQEIEK